MNKYQEALDRIKNKTAIIDGEKMTIGAAYCDTLSILQELVNKETPMEVNMEDYHLEDEYQYPIYSCPKCAKHITDGDSYCRHCGQRLLFIDIEEVDTDA